MLGIAEAAEAIGFRSLGVKISFEKLADEAPLPCVVHWQQNHFVVVYAIKGAGSRWMAGVRGGFKGKPEIDTLLRTPTHSFDFATEEEIIIPTQQPALAQRAPAARRGTVYVADPSRGLITYTAEEFCQGWLSARTATHSEGTALLLEPTPAFY